MEELFSRVKVEVLKRKGDWPRLAARAEVSYSWLTKFAAGKYDEVNVGYRRLEKLDAAMQEDRPQ